MIWLRGFLCLGLLFGSTAAAPPALAEAPECSDAIDNDSDGYTDHPDDPDCDSPEDNSEADRTSRFPAQMTIRYDRPRGHFTGNLSSDLPRGCRSNRLVRLKKPRRGRDLIVGSDKTNSDYLWIVPKKDARGRYYAVAPGRERTRRDGTMVTCDRIRSVTIRVT